MKEQRKVPQIRFKGFTDDWEQRKLGDIGDTFTGLSGKTKEDFGHGNAKFVTYMNVFSNPISNINQVESVEVDYKQNEIKYGDIFFTTSSETPEEVGMSSVWLDNKENNYLNSFCFGFRQFVKNDPYYMGYMLRNPMVRKNITFLAQGISRYNISKNQMMNIEIPITNMEEQKLIGIFFKEIDNLITLHQRKCDKLVEVKKSLLEKMFPKNSSKIPEIRFKGFTDDWEQRKLGDIGDTFTGLSGKTKEDFGHGNAKFVTYMNVFSNPISNINQVESVEVDYKQNEIKYGDIFFTTSSETPEEVGMSSVWLDNKENNYLNSFCFGFRQFVKNDPYYMGYMLRNPMVRKNITFLAQGISRYNISKNQMMNIEIPITNMEEQKLIGIFFKEIDNLITLHQRKLEKLKEVKKSMLERMFV